MAGNLDPFTPTILSLSTCKSKRELYLHEEMVGSTNLAKAAKVEQGKGDDLRFRNVME